MERLTHAGAGGKARMVDVTEKPSTRREAVARAAVRMNPQTLELVLAGNIPKGDVLVAARIAGIMAAKRTPWLIPLCHPLHLSVVDISFRRGGEGLLEIEARAAAAARTGVEMEAMTAAAVCALTIYDMCKGVDRWAVIEGVRLVSKSGGKSGVVRREGESEWPERL